MSSGETDTKKKKLADYEAKLSCDEAVEKYLAVPDRFGVRHVEHWNHRSAGIYLTAASHLDMPAADVLDIIQAHASRILPVRLWKAPGCIASFLPEEINTDRQKNPTAYQDIGQQAIKLEQHIGNGFASAQVRAWMKVPEVGYVDVYMDIGLPSRYRLTLDSVRCDPRTGETLELQVRSPAELKGQRYQTTKGSVHFTSYWETPEQFLTELAGCRGAKL